MRSSEPVAAVQRGNLVYVLNAGGTSNVTGFHFTAMGELKPIPHSTVFLTTANSGAGSVALSPDGQTLLVTEKITGNIDAFAVHMDGTLGPIVTTPSVGAGLFGILFAPNGAALTTQTGPPARPGNPRSPRIQSTRARRSRPSARMFRPMPQRLAGMS